MILGFGGNWKSEAARFRALDSRILAALSVLSRVRFLGVTWGSPEMKRGLKDRAAPRVQGPEFNGWGGLDEGLSFCPFL